MTYELWVAGAAASGVILSWLGFWLSWANRISKVENMAANAVQEAVEAKAENNQLTQQVTAYQTTFNHFQLLIAREYVDRSMMREVEQRVINAVEKVGEDTSRQIDQLTKRVNAFASNGGNNHQRT